MLRTVEGTLDPEGTIRFREEVWLEKSQRVLVTLLGDSDANGEAGNVSSVLALLQQPAFRERPIGSAAELEQTVSANRDA